MGNKAFRQAEGNDWRGVRMEQVTEAVKAETTEKRENRGNRKPAVKWLIVGLIVSLAASGIFTACYGIFERRAESRRNEQYIADPLETSNTITYLYQNCYLLYRDLYNKEHQTSLSYVELYMQPTEGNEWLNDDRKRAEVAYGDTEELTIPEGADPENYAAQGILAAQTGEYLEEHFNTLESSFGQLNNLYDYRIRDTKTGEILSNLADTDIVAEDQSFYLTFVFDDYGNDATLGNTVIGSDTTTLRKTAAEVIRNCGLTRMVDANMRSEISAGHNTMFRLEMPRNCEITYCISRQAAQSLGQNGQYIYYDQDMNNVSVYFSMGDQYTSYYLSGCQQMFLILCLLIFLLALVLPGLEEERAWEKVVLLKLPVEAIVVILVVIAGIGSEQVVGLVSWVRSGHALNTVLQGNSAQIQMSTTILTYALNVLAVAALFFIAWCLGVSLRAMRVQGARAYLRQHSLCYLLVPFWKKLWRGMKKGFSIGRDKVVDVYHDAEHFDVTKDEERRFVVSTAHQSQIEVYGTGFNVEAYAADGRISTTLVEGSVGFFFKDKAGEAKMIKLKPYHKLVYTPESGETKMFATSCESEIAWKDGKIVFKNTSMEDILHMLGKRYNVDFVVKSNRIKEYSFTGTFSTQRLERILEYFKISSQINWRYLDSDEISDKKQRIEIY